MTKFKKYKFSELYSMSSGISSKPEQAGHGFPFASFSTVFNNYFMPDILHDLMNTSKAEQEIYSIKKGDIFLTRTSETLDELGMSSVALKNYNQATFSGFVKRLRPIKIGITDEKYIGFYLRSKFFRKTMNNNAIMTLRASLNEEIFSYLNLYLPDYETQKNIGELLYLLNSKISINNKIFAELEVMAKALYDYWFVQFDFPNAQGKPYKTAGGKLLLNSVLKREIPEKWKNISLEDLCNIYQPKTISGKELIADGKYLVYGSNSVIGNYDQYNHEKSEIAVSCRGNCGNIFRTIPKSWITGNAMIFKLKDQELHNEFLYQALHWINIKNTSTGSVQGQLTRVNVAPLQILFPARDILIKFNKHAEPIVNKKLLILKENQKLTELRNWILPMLMNGQVKVN